MLLFRPDKYRYLFRWGPPPFPFSCPSALQSDPNNACHLRLKVIQTSGVSPHCGGPTGRHNGEVSECYIWHNLPKYQCDRGKCNAGSFMPTRRGSCAVGVLKLRIACHPRGSGKCIACIRKHCIDVYCIMLLNSLMCLQTSLTVREICNRLILLLAYFCIHPYPRIYRSTQTLFSLKARVNLHWELPAELLLLGKPFCLSVHAWLCVITS